MSHLTLFVPALFTDMVTDSAGDPRRSGSRAALSALLRRAATRNLDPVPADRRLFELFAVPLAASAPLPAAALTAALDKLPALEGPVMRVDPVHLRADPNQILLFCDPEIMPTEAEADQLLETLNRGFDDIRFRRGHYPGRWYVHLQSTALTSAPQAANGRSIAAYLPTGDAAGELKQLMNDAQMLMHDAPANAEREARGLPPINSIWPWGNGDFSARPAGPDFVYGNDALAGALAARAGIDCSARADWEAVRSAFERGAAAGLVVLGCPTGPAELPAQSFSLDGFEQNWCRPLMRALNRFRLGRLTVIADRQSFTVSPVDRFKFWRSARAYQEALS